jgi:hypothetical protein
MDQHAQNMASNQQPEGDLENVGMHAACSAVAQVPGTRYQVVIPVNGIASRST